MQSLLPESWLIDEIINFVSRYLEFILPEILQLKMKTSMIDDNNVERKKHLLPNSKKPYLLLTTFFSTAFLTTLEFQFDLQLCCWSLKLSGLPIKDVRCIKNTRKLSTLLNEFQIQKMTPVNKYEMILIPINLEKWHWYLVGIFPPQKMVVVFDSVRHSSNSYKSVLTNVCKWYNELLKYINNNPEYLEVIDDSWRIVTSIKNLPRQNNGGDCGVFTLMNMIHLIQGNSFHVMSPEQVLLFRKHMIVWFIKFYDHERYFGVEKRAFSWCLQHNYHGNET